MTRRILFCSTLVLAASSVLAGSTKDIASSVPAFAQAVALTATNVQAAFDTVQGTYCDAAVLNYAVAFTGLGDKDPSTLCQTWLKPGTMAARAQILQGLKAYASELSSLTASDAGNVDAATTALGTSLKTLTGTAPFSELSKPAAAKLSVGTDIFVTAVNAIGNWLIQRKLRKDLPGEIEKMDPYIQSISQLLVADIGVVGADPAHPSEGDGLRQVLWVQYGKEITAWDTYVSKHYLGENVSPDARLAAVKQLVALANQQRAADQVLAQVAATLKQMAQAHTELVQATKTKQNLIANLSDLLAEAERLNTYYQSLATGK